MVSFSVFSISCRFPGNQTVIGLCIKRTYVENDYAALALVFHKKVSESQV